MTPDAVLAMPLSRLVRHMRHGERISEQINKGLDHG